MTKKLTVKQYVEKLTHDNPNARIEVLYDPQGGWGHSNSMNALPESEWDDYRVEQVEQFGDLIAITAY